MFFNFLQFVEALNPAVVLIENVPEYQNTASMEVIRSVLSSLGYSYKSAFSTAMSLGLLSAASVFVLLRFPTDRRV